MGNKDRGREYRDMNFIDYSTEIGAEIKNIKNTGISFTNIEVFKYFKLLREYALNRIKWTSNVIPEYELRLIEWNIFHYGKCAMLRPKILGTLNKTDNTVVWTCPSPLIYQCAYEDINYRNGRPRRISIFNNNNSDFVVETNYYEEEFTIFTDAYVFANNNTPFSHIAYEFACKLHELDLAFNANSHKQRFPFVFNNGSLKEGDTDTRFTANNGGQLAELMRSAYGRNEQFVEVPEFMVGVNGFLYEPAHVENQMLNHIEAQKKLYQSYFELLGEYTNKEKGGVYTVKRLQEDGDETPDFITQTMKNTRILCAKEACRKFDIDLTLEVV